MFTTSHSVKRASFFFLMITMINVLWRAIRIRSKLAKRLADAFAHLNGRSHQQVTRLLVDEKLEQK